MTRRRPWTAACWSWGVALSRPSVRTGCARVVACVAICSALSSCTSPVDVVAPSPDSASAQACRALVDALPTSVVGLEARDVEPADTLAAAWGDPPIVLRCGVERPARLQPTSFCFVVNDVGWYAEDENGPMDGTTPPRGDVVFTTIGRSPYVEMTVPPDDSRPAVDPLTDVSAAIRKHTREEQPCQ